MEKKEYIKPTADIVEFEVDEIIMEDPEIPEFSFGDNFVPTWPL